MQPFRLVLHETYYQNGFFNVAVAFDQYVRNDNGAIRIYMRNTDDYIDGHVDRTSNPNGTARIFGGHQLRDWFKREFNLKDAVTVKFLSPEMILLLPATD